MIVVPYSPGKICEETLNALYKTELRFETIPVEGDTGYYDLFCSLWNRIDDDLIIIEHDIVPTETSIQEMMECPERWCANPYDYLGFKDGIVGLGHTKFSRELQAQHKHLPHRIAGAWQGHPPNHWCTLDCQIQSELNHGSGAYALNVHRHSTQVEHLGKGVSHGCIQAPNQ